MNKYEIDIRHLNDISRVYVDDLTDKMALEEAINNYKELVDKSVAKKVIITTAISETRRGKGIQKRKLKWCYCPSCKNQVANSYLGYTTKAIGCPYCLQALDWSD